MLEPWPHKAGADRPLAQPLLAGQVGELLGVSAAEVHEMRFRLPPWAQFHVGGPWFWDKAEIEAWIVETGWRHGGSLPS